MRQIHFSTLRRGLAGIFLCGTALLCGAVQVQALPSDAVQRQDEACLRAAYPQAVQGLVREGDVIWLALRDGQRVLYADERPPVRGDDGALEDATVRQTLAEPYPKGLPTTEPPTGDPGRDRSTALMRALYGAAPEQLQLAKVTIGNAVVPFATRQQAADALRRVVVTLEELGRDPALRPFIFPLGGGQYWRKIAGTERLSAHCFGIAIDLNPKKGKYWRGSSVRPPAYPQAIVNAFEAQGFIWGGRWEHFDAMHFEYRPELFCRRPAE